MAVILPLVSWWMLWRLCVSVIGQDRREAVITASLIWGVLLVLITEALSVLHVLALPGVALAWVILLIVCLFAIYRFKPGRPPVVGRSSPRTWWEWLFMSLISIIFVITGITALVAPPNTWDSMTYHMTRVAFWAQNGTVAHYPTVNIRQLLFPPFAEYAILHTYLLSGGDQFANLIQFFSMIGSTIVVSLLARDLGAKREGQWLAALLCATLPTGILQASSTQNDYMVTFWLLCLTWHILRAAQTRLTGWNAVEIGVCVGLALLTKATGYVYCVSLLAAVLGIALWQWRWRAWQVLALMGVCALLINGAFYVRNLQSFGGLFGPSGAQGDSFNAEISPRVVLSNLARNTAMHLMIAPNRLDDALGFQSGVQTIIETFHTIIGISASDPRTSFGVQSFAVPKWNMNEDFAGNPVHLLVFVVAVGLFCLSYRAHRWARAYLLLLCAHFIVFSALLRWMIWIARFHLFPFALMMAFAAVFLSQRRWLVYGLLLLIIPMSVGPLFINDTRPWMGTHSIFVQPREEQYSTARRQVGDEMRQAAEMVQAAGCDQIGVGAGGDEWVYPLFPIFRALDWPVRMELISGSRAYPLGDFSPCGLILYDGFPLEHYMGLDASAYTPQSDGLFLLHVSLLKAPPPGEKR